MPSAVYIPKLVCSQQDLEREHGVSAGKYTLGLGQSSISVPTGDAEDVNSVAMTVLSSLLKKFDVPLHRVGRLEVGTESAVDKSKSVKSVLMSLFGANTDIEGVGALLSLARLTLERHDKCMLWRDKRTLQLTCMA